MRETFHLVALEIWSASDTGLPYGSWSLATEGFTHCTDGVGELGATFDRFYASDPRPFVAINLDLDALDVRGATTLRALHTRTSTARSHLKPSLARAGWSETMTVTSAG